MAGGSSFSMSAQGVRDAEVGEEVVQVAVHEDPQHAPFGRFGHVGEGDATTGAAPAFGCCQGFSLMMVPGILRRIALSTKAHKSSDSPQDPSIQAHVASSGS